ncbi:MAG: pantoate--beta-alanine ligase [Chloroflexi bacterium]|nr:pantoate--beta-alanine ligase [Chloroflexota bacterium]
MRIIENSQEMAQACREACRPLGLVPTMGALHEGHLTLVRRARQENQRLAVSIFVNPTQFSQGEDLSRYPRDLERDLALLRQEGVDLVYAPSSKEIYPPGFDTWVDPGALADRLEGAARPGHFRGVATVVTKLFNLVRPDRAYFGQKDGQQVLVIQRLVLDLNLGVEVVVVPTVREPDGLALSTRNSYLTPEQRKAAPVIFRALSQALVLHRHGMAGGEELRSVVRRILELEPLVEQIEYVSLADCGTLEELDVIAGRAMLSVAVRLGQTRLIDNLILY